MSDATGQPSRPLEGGGRSALALSALGIVFGDIGTSPLYAFRAAFAGPSIGPTDENILGVLSLIFWSLTLVVSLKYLTILLHADNDGEGGILALLALLDPWRPGGDRRFLAFVGLFGATLLYGDGAITPAISVLSAVEGLEVASSRVAHLVVPATVGILVLLFLAQSRGTARIGSVFGPVMVLWFAVCALLGLAGIARNPTVLLGMDPRYAMHFFLSNGRAGFLVLGSVFLVVTGAEAMYADLGHFGRAPIRYAWFVLVFPALVLNYFGQGAHQMASRGATQPFFELAPASARLPLVFLATAATVIASQAVITGAFSLTRQAIQLGHLPRLRVVQTSVRERGQIYIPAVNTTLGATTILLVLAFRRSGALAAAYGVAVVTTMAVTSLLLYVYLRERRAWSHPRALALISLFLVVDLAFLGANLFKIAAGGWVPLAIGSALYVVMSTWWVERNRMQEAIRAEAPSIEALLEDLASHPPHRIPGTAVFVLADETQGAPLLARHLHHNRVMHEQVVLVTTDVQLTPRVPLLDKVAIERMPLGVVRLRGAFGFMEQPNVPKLLQIARYSGLDIDPREATYYAGREIPLASPDLRVLGRWREALFAFMSRNTARSVTYYGVPAEQVGELGGGVVI
jgi:KUP system potassium uptake protein